MLLAFLPAGLRTGNAPPPKDGTLVFEANMDGVEAFVDGAVSRGVICQGNPHRACPACARELIRFKA